ncbi:MAG TPA: aldo/keto reductase [Methylomirabilota bacterium]|nr:aldo/keto reductase [Methylomirabilota bacterium]
MLTGYATADGTAAYRARLAARAAEGHFGRWRDLQVSSVGVGTYLGDDDAATDAAYTAAITRALELGLNVVDSAINYRNQRSERSIGAALRGLTGAGRLAREEVLLATKGGFICFDGQRPPNPNAYLVETYVRPGVFSTEDVVAGCHCMTPRYLADQLDRSRANLGIATVDVYYVHNPEMQLGEVDRPTFLARMRAAFEFLEAAVSDGKIGVYGTATWNGYRAPPSAQDHLSLAELVGLAREVGGADHHFKVIQLPYNLAMTEALTSATQPVGREMVSALEAARRLDVYVMTSASILQGKLARELPAALAEVLTGLETDAQRALQFVRSTPGVGTALCGMKNTAHVEENARLVAVPPAPREKLFTQG